MSNSCSKCGEEDVFMICDGCRWSSVSKSFISEERDRSIISVYPGGRNREEAVREKIAFYEELLDDIT